ncbi:unnamed protein product, partial [Polarella glacialis]
VLALVVLDSRTHVPAVPEAAARRAGKAFALKVDADKDGQLSEAELLAAGAGGDRKHSIEELVSFHDTDRDGKVTVAEVEESWVMLSTVPSRTAALQAPAWQSRGGSPSFATERRAEERLRRGVAEELQASPDADPLRALSRLRADLEEIARLRRVDLHREPAQVRRSSSSGSLNSSCRQKQALLNSRSGVSVSLSEAVVAYAAAHSRTPPAARPRSPSARTPPATRTPPTTPANNPKQQQQQLQQLKQQQQQQQQEQEQQQQHQQQHQQTTTKQPPATRPRSQSASSMPIAQTPPATECVRWANESTAESAADELRIVQAIAEARERDLEARLKLRDAELARLESALLAANKVAELAAFCGGHEFAVSCARRGGSGKRVQADPAVQETSEAARARPLDCSAVLRNTVAVCGASLLEGASKRAAAAASAAAAAGKEEGAAAADALWAEVLERQAAGLVELERDTKALRMQADLSRRLSRTLDKKELLCLVAAQQELITELLKEVTAESASERLLKPRSEPSSKAHNDHNNNHNNNHSINNSNNNNSNNNHNIAWLRLELEKAAVRSRLQPPHSELLQLLDLSFASGGSCAALESDPQWHHLLGRDAVAAAEALLLERERLAVAAAERQPLNWLPQQAPAAVGLSRAEAACSRLSQEGERLRHSAVAVRSSSSNSNNKSNNNNNSSNSNSNSSNNIDNSSNHNSNNNNNSSSNHNSSNNSNNNNHNNNK